MGVGGDCEDIGELEVNSESISGVIYWFLMDIERKIQQQGCLKEESIERRSMAFKEHIKMVSCNYKHQKIGNNASQLWPKTLPRKTAFIVGYCTLIVPKNTKIAGRSPRLLTISHIPFPCFLLREILDHVSVQ